VYLPRNIAVGRLRALAEQEHKISQETHLEFQTGTAEDALTIGVLLLLWQPPQLIAV
jgi:hypothetical protein